MSEKILLFPVPQEWDASKRKSSKTFKIFHKMQTVNWIHKSRRNVLLFWWDWLMSLNKILSKLQEQWTRIWTKKGDKLKKKYTTKNKNKGTVRWMARQFQKPLFRGVPWKRCSENMQQIYRKTPVPMMFVENYESLIVEPMIVENYE